MATKVYGASDDLIEFDGEVGGEVGYYSHDEEDDGVLLMFSDGTVWNVGKPQHPRRLPPKDTPKQVGYSLAFGGSCGMLWPCLDRFYRKTSIRFPSTSDALRPGGLGNFFGPRIRRCGGSATEGRAMQIKDIPGFPGYSVSDTGVVFGKRNGTSQPLRLQESQKGYLYICGTGVFGSKERITVHRAVLLAFVGPPGFGEEARHLDGNKKNNSLSNLKWGTKRENCQDKLRHGMASSGLTPRDIRKIRRLRKEGVMAKHLAVLYGISSGAITDITKRRTWSFVR